MRIRCILLGCRIYDQPACGRCMAGIYDADFIQMGHLEPLTDRIARIRGWFRTDNARCAECRRLLSLPRMFSESKRNGEFWSCNSAKFCSDECRDQWLPF